MLELRPLIDGSAFSIFAIVNDGSCETTQFLSKLEKDSEAELDSILALLDRTANHGPPLNKQKSRDVGNGIYEFKAKSVRLCYFFDEGKVIVCTHGFHKPAKKVQNREIKYAGSLKDDYFEAQKKGPIPIEKKKLKL